MIWFYISVYLIAGAYVGAQAAFYLSVDPIKSKTELAAVVLLTILSILFWPVAVGIAVAYQRYKNSK